ncbi:cellulase family glycosylhydrolase [Austwickia sp. TVS 96-490-7B]|uniref:cellulase family glycosylhydrolase n=1 Tax=Austwickia sp. TVS 96-490-7B TaxID=2830843 RepID=UPI001C59828F|nr:cellulase family glycosylhydrolase [Austwickia sp. TVS 96-490-7B]
MKAPLAVLVAGTLMSPLPAAAVGSAPSLTSIPAAVSAAAASAAATPIAAAPAAAAGAARWGTAGRWITDEQGRVVITHGVNEVEKNSPFAPDAVGFDEEDAKFLQQQGFTSVRLGTIWAGVEPKPGQFDDAYLARIKRTVDMLHRHGIASLLDFHQDMVNPKFQGNGWPDWAVLDGGAPNVIKAGFPGNYFLNMGVKNSYESFMNDKPASDGVGIATHYAKAWAHTAAYFKGTPGVMGFDLYNEPFPGHDYLGCIMRVDGCPAQDAKLSAVQQKSIDAIRAVDPATTIYYEPMQFFNIAKPTNVAVKGKNLAFSFHDYCTNQAVFKNYYGCKSPDRKVFENAEQQYRKHDHALLMTEFGAITAKDVLHAQTNLAMENRVGYQYWAYTGGDPTTAGPGNEQALVFDTKKPPTGNNVDWKKLEAIAVPHPDRVAGVPGRYGYDRNTKTFTMKWVADKATSGVFGAGSITTVRIPAIAMPKGYTIKATGAKVVSKPDAPTVELAWEKGVTAAEVTIVAKR